MNTVYIWKRLREDWLTLLLVLLLMLTVAWSLDMADRGVENTDLLFLVVAAAVLLGYFAAISIFDAFTVILASNLVGIVFIWLLAGSRLGGGMAFRERMFSVLEIVYEWVFALVSGSGEQEGTFVFLIILCLVGWQIAAMSVWSVFRRYHIWHATIPGGLALVFNTYYYYGPIVPLNELLGVYIFLTFILAVQIHIANREYVWRQVGIPYSASVRWSLLRTGVALVFSLVVLAWFTPAVPVSATLSEIWSEPRETFQQVEQTFDRMFGGVQGRAVLVSPTYYGGTQVTMGGAVNLRNVPVFTVTAPEGYRYYWRSKVYDIYANGRWNASVDSTVEAEFGNLPAETSEPYLMRQNVEQRFSVHVVATSLLYAAPQPVSFSARTVLVDLQTTVPGDYGSLVAVRARDAVVAGDTYIAISSISIADAALLRAASTEYPDWISQYLVLPESVTDRTRMLAADLAVSSSNAYDMTRAIESYLRENIIYNEQVDAPPAGVEPVDYLLFERPEGYCTYYASAMAVMLRSVGIPARVAAGFSRGIYDPSGGNFSVIESDAHTWVEVYFPRYGWIEFEPTSARDPILHDAPPPEEFLEPTEERPIGGQLGPQEGDLPEDAEDESEIDEVAQPDRRALFSNFRIPGFVRWVFLAAALVATAVSALWYRVEMHGMRNLSEVARSYARLNVYAPMVGAEAEKGATPRERAQRYREEVPGVAMPVDTIVKLHMEEQYAPPPASERERLRLQERAGQAWQAARRIIVRTAIARAFRQVIPPFLRRRRPRL